MSANEPVSRLRSACRHAPGRRPGSRPSGECTWAVNRPEVDPGPEGLIVVRERLGGPLGLQGFGCPGYLRARVELG